MTKIFSHFPLSQKLLLQWVVKGTLGGSKETRMNGPFKEQNSHGVTNFTLPSYLTVDFTILIISFDTE